MKRILTTLAVIVGVMLATSCVPTNEQAVSTITGVWERGTPETIRLFAIENGELIEIASAQRAENGEFFLAFRAQTEGFFAIGVGEPPIRLRRNFQTFYFKPGDDLNVRILPSGFELIGDNTPENRQMEKWQAFIQPMEDIAFGTTPEGRRATYVDFFPLLVEKEAAMETIRWGNTRNRTFNRMFEKYRQVDFLSQVLTFSRSPRSRHPQNESDFPDFFRNIDIEGITSTDFLLHYPLGIRLLADAYMISMMRDVSISAEERSRIMRSPAQFYLSNPRTVNPILRGELVVFFAAGNRTLAGFNEYVRNFGHLIQTDSQQERMRAIEVALFADAKGEEAIDFRFPDINGNMVALSDFRGQVVYLDVWATWCAPCRAEVPHMRELAAEFAGNDNLVILGVSVDASRSRSEWEEYVRANKTFGVQLFAGDDAQENLMVPYQIRGIPRFILIGKDGRVILTDAPRPSSAEIRAILNDALSRGA